MAGDGKIDIKITGDDQLSPKLKQAKENTQKLTGEVTKSGKSNSMRFTEMKSAIDLATVALSKMVGAFDELVSRGRLGAVDKDLTGAFERFFGSADEGLARLRAASSGVLPDTDIMRFGNTLARYGADLHQVDLIMREAKSASNNLGVEIGTVNSAIAAAVASGDAGGLRVQFGQIADVVALEVQKYELLNGAMSTTERRTKTMTILTQLLEEKHRNNASAVEANIDRYDRMNAAMANLDSEVSGLTDDLILYHKELILGTGFTERATNAVAKLREEKDFLRGAVEGVDSALVRLVAGPLAPVIGMIESAYKGTNKLAEVMSKTTTEARALNDEFDRMGDLAPSIVGMFRMQAGAGSVFGPAAEGAKEAAKETDKYSRQIDLLLAQIARIKSAAAAKPKEDIFKGLQLPDLVDPLKREDDQAAMASTERMERGKYQIWDKWQKTRAGKMAAYNRRLESIESGTLEAIRANQIDLSISITALYSNTAMAVGEFFVNAFQGVEGAGMGLLASLMDGLATYAAEMGAMMIANGAGISALMSLSGPAAIAAGVALIAASGALKAGAAMLRGAASGGSASTGGVSPGGFTGNMNSTTTGGVPTPRDTGGETGGAMTIVYNINAPMGGAAVARSFAESVNKHAGRGAPKIRSGAIA